MTGSNKGIGLAIVKALLDNHADTFVYLCSRVKENGETAMASIKQENKDRLQLLVLDVNSDESVRAARETLGPIKLYGLVNNAGIATGSPDELINTNYYGAKRVIDNFIDLIDGGKIVSISSGSAPMFLEKCSPEKKRMMIDPAIEMSTIDQYIKDFKYLYSDGGVDACKAAGWGDDGLSYGYGFSKACLNALTVCVARERKGICITAASPGLVLTDLFLPVAKKQGVEIEELAKQWGHIQPSESVVSTMKLLFDDSVTSGLYYGSDGLRSPMSFYRKPGSDEYDGSNGL